MSRFKKMIRKVKDGTLQSSLQELLWTYRVTVQYKREILLYTMLSIFSMLITMLLSLNIQKLVDAMIDRNLTVLLQIGGFYVGIGILNIGLSMVSARVSAAVKLKVNQENTQRVYRKILVADWETLEGHHSGDLLARITKDVDNLSEAVVGWGPELITKSLQVVLAVAAITYFDASMLLVLVCASPIVLLGSKVFWHKSYESNEAQKKVESRLLSFEKESFHNLQTIKAFDLSDTFECRMEKLQDETVRTGKQVSTYNVLSWAFMYTSGQLAAIICLAWAVYHVYTGTISIGTTTLIALMAGMVASGFNAIIKVIPKAMSTVASAARVRELLELEVESLQRTAEEERFLKLAGQDGAGIRVEDMSFHYANGRQVFDQVGFQVEPGQIVAFVGASGEGKTTLLRLLLGLMAPQQGTCSFYLQNQMEQSSLEWNISATSRRMITYVPQGNTMMQGTIAENLRMLDSDAPEEQIWSKLKMACADGFVQKLPEGLESPVGESGQGFSEGQNQRLAIARAFMSDAPVFLLDEATSALDVTTERRVLQNIVRDGKTCILTTHRPTVLELCDKVYRISQGKIVEIDEAEINQLLHDF